MAQSRLGKIHEIGNRMGIKIPHSQPSQPSQSLNQSQSNTSTITPPPNIPTKITNQKITSQKITPHNLDEVYSRLHRSSPLYRPPIQPPIIPPSVEPPSNEKSLNEIKQPVKLVPKTPSAPPKPKINQK